ncbi:carbohydrate-binding family 9-like protein [Flagellimonas flava]|uniref:Carbohydrate family 9 binding domain-like n=1 Tax=Flagellimonas flava TaxID=570519 RepID=A0A1M5M1R8_9FLAO|nr:carbohydrate-binding family 9-like protein [Allomuricauda flava]SHG70859.1 Carbohydrate family 9 binding domain-like [Allomuricauda flava]
MEKYRKLISLILFFLYVGCIILIAQEEPRSYVAYKTSDSMIIDGIPDESSWTKAPWSDLFIDIEGIKKPTYDTRVKMLWDENNIYFFAQMEEPHVWGDITEHDAVIFHNNDFEVFLDPEADVHGYYELEWNVLNTIWDQYLTAPYRAGNETINGWESLGLQSAVAVEGTLNDPSDEDQGWTLEIAIPFRDLRTGYYQDNVPKSKFWRVGFSRVNWDFDITNGKYSRKKNPETGEFLHEYNWVWSPQYVINMHEPERWGYVYFSEKEVGRTPEEFIIPQDEHIKWFLYELYRDLIGEDQRKIKWQSADGEIFLKPKQILGKPVRVMLDKHDFGFTLWTKSPFTKNKLSVTADGKFRTHKK